MAAHAMNTNETVQSTVCGLCGENAATVRFDSGRLACVMCVVMCVEDEGDVGLLSAGVNGIGIFAKNLSQITEEVCRDGRRPG